MRSFIYILALLCGFSATGIAQEPGNSMFSMNGFGTLGVVHSSEDEADFNNSVLQPNGAGHTREWAMGVDSRLGLQLSASLTDKLTATVQVIAEHSYDNSYTPSVEWANLKYDFTTNFSVRVGRIVLPIFMASDYRKVGYANPWVRPPLEIYTLVPITNNDGVDVIYQYRLGPTLNTFQGFYGRKNTRAPGGLLSESRNAFGFFNVTEFGDASVRFGYHQTEQTIGAVNNFFDLFRQFGPQGNDLADRYNLADKKIEILTVGADYDPGDWFVMAEWAKTRRDFFLGEMMGWYATTGYRYGKFMPYLSIAQRRKLSHTTDPGLDTAALPPFVTGFASSLNAGLNSFLAANDQVSISVGLRWDFMPGFDLKVQFDHMRLDDNSSGTLTNLQPGFRGGGHYNLFSAAIDVVF